MRTTITPTLFFDPQDTIPAYLCPRCGGCLYAPSLRCLRCDREAGL